MTTTHIVYMARGGGRAMITQDFCEVVGDTAQTLTVRSSLGDSLTIPRGDVYAIKQGRLARAEVDAVFAEHGHEQVR